jgi:signal transduction histidine kinase
MSPKNLPKNLGNKYFLLFSGMTVFLFILIIILQIFITQYLILKNETDFILDKLDNNRKKLQDSITYQKYLTNNTKFLITNNKNTQEDFLNQQDSTGAVKILYFEEKENGSYYSEWFWLNQIINNLDKPLTNDISYFYAVDYPVVYSITYTFIEKNHLKNLILTISLINHNVLGDYENLYVCSSKSRLNNNIPEWLQIYLYNNKYDLQKEDYRLFQYNRELTYYFTRLEEYSGNYKIFAVNSYHREINIFFTNAFYIITLMLFLSLIILIFAFGKWFSKEMLKPVKNLASQMLTIAENPSEINLMDYDIKSGELQKIISIYNNMALGLKNYQYSLLQYKTLFENSKLGLFWMDEFRKIKLYNSEFARILELSYDKNQVLENDICDISPLKKEFFKDDAGDTFTDLELWLESLNKYVSVSIQCLEIDNQKVYIGVLGDVTKHRELQESKRSLEMELIKINRLAEMGKRTHGIVHNLNSPLNSILGYAQLLKDEFPENPDILKIINSAKQMSQSVKSLLTKIKKDSLANPDLIDLNQFLNMEIEIGKHHLFFKNEVVLHVDLQPDIPQILATYGDLSQVFSVLFNNALDSMHSSKFKTLTIKSFANQDSIGFSIKDTGSGIHPDNLKKIFEPNFSTKELTTSGGFGLGLAIADSIIKKFNGMITVSSHLNSGSEFTVILPTSLIYSSRG